jgi:tetratricopeptide (TPR) repeat protein
LLSWFVNSRFRPTAPHSTAVSARRVLLALACVCCSLAGCKSTVDDVDIKDVYGPAGRLAKNNLVEKAKRDVKGDPAEGQAEFDAAHQLYDEQNYIASRKLLANMLKKCKKKNLPIEEDVLFYKAECDFQLGHYPAAQDGYDELLKKFGSTQYFNKAIGRLFAIGRFWLHSPKPASEVELASFKEEDGEERLSQLREAYDPGDSKVKPNFTDKSRPFFDTPGRAVQALHSVTLHDPAGPLADEALMILALYHLRKKDYREADINFAQIRESTNKHRDRDKYLQAAYVLGAHASLKSYLGSGYDGKQLEEARKLTKNAIRLFPDIPQRPKLDNDLRKIDAEMIEREWQRVIYYKGRGDKESVALYCEYIINTYPESPQAVKSRELLIELGPQYSQGILATPLFNTKKEPAASNKDGANKDGSNKDEPNQEKPSDEPEEPVRLRVSDSDKDAKPISESP